MNRFYAIFRRYGWRTPFVVLVLSIMRFEWVRQDLFRRWLILITRGTKGKHIRFGRDVRIPPGCDLTLGQDLYIGDRCVFELSIAPRARVTVGDNTWISHDCHIGSYGGIDIGANVLIGEFVSLRDTSHSYANPDVPITHQDDIVGTITISDDVWIGRGTIVIGRPDGVTIGYGSVIGANSVVSSSIPPYSVIAGTPARHIRFRNEDMEKS
jgi:acetyltransferase-like isoleucine patch superfamily enzyme